MISGKLEEEARRRRRLEEHNLQDFLELTLIPHCSQYLRFMTSVSGRLPAGNVWLNQSKLDYTVMRTATLHGAAGSKTGFR